MAAGIVLTVAPGLIPSVVGIRLEPSADVVAYLLAGAEFGFAVLSFGGSRLTDSRALRLIVWSCIALHASSGVLEVYAYVQGASVAIFGYQIFGWQSPILPRRANTCDLTPSVVHLIAAGKVDQPF